MTDIAQDNIRERCTTTAPSTKGQTLVQYDDKHDKHDAIITTFKQVRTIHTDIRISYQHTALVAISKNQGSSTESNKGKSPIRQKEHTQQIKVKKGVRKELNKNLLRDTIREKSQYT